MKVRSAAALARWLDAQPPAQVYAFDLFDTLVGRLLPPEYIKFLVAAFIRRQLLPTEADTDARGIYTRRRAIEDALKAEAVADGLDPEYRYADALGRLLADFGIDDPAAAARVHAYERDLEAGAWVVHSPIVALLRDLHAAGRRVVLISDNYLAEEDIRALLAGRGFLESVERIFISSGPRLRKDSGRLFEHVLRTLDIRPEGLVHVGDNGHSDYAVPRARGIRAVLLAPPADARRRAVLERRLPVDPPSPPDADVLQDVLLQGLRTRWAAAHAPAVLDVALALAPVFLVYTEALLARARALGVARVFFLAREGLMLQRLFDRLSGGAVASVYVGVSRTSTFVLSVPRLDPQRIEDLLASYVAHYIPRVSVRQLCAHLRIPPERGTEVAAAHGMAWDRGWRVAAPRARARLAGLLRDPRMQAAYTDARGAYKTLFMDYLRGLGMLDDSRILLADIGWAGSIQEFLARLLREEGLGRQVFGYYLGYDREWDRMKNPGLPTPEVYKDGLVYRALPDDRFEAALVSRILLELIPMAPHGTVTGYRRGPDGVPAPETAWALGEREQFERRIQPVQALIEQAVVALAPVQRALEPVVSLPAQAAAALRGMHALMVRPPRRVARHYARYVLYDLYFGIPRRLPFFRARWWWEAVQAMGPIAWPARGWNAAREGWGLLDELSRRALILTRVLGPRPLLAWGWSRLARRPPPPGLATQIATQYRFRPPPPPPPAPALRHAVYLYEARSPAEALRQARTLPGVDGATAEIWYPRGGGATPGAMRWCPREGWRTDAPGAPDADADPTRVHDVVLAGRQTLFARDYLHRIDAAFARVPDADLIYTDSDSLLLGRHACPRFRPAWSPEYFLEYDYLGDGLCLRTATFGTEAPAWLAAVAREGVYAAMLRRLPHLRRVEHLPGVSVHAPHRPGRAPRAVYAALAAREPGTQVIRRPAGGFRLRASVQGTPRVTIIIPFRDKVAYLERCVRSLFDCTAYPHYELLLVDNRSAEPATRAYLDTLRGDPRVRLIPYDAPFHYAALNNAAVAQSEAPFVLLLNNDTEALTPHWLEEMLVLAQRPDAGCVGAKLLYPDGAIQHAGVICDFRETYPAGHIFHRESGRARGYEQRLVSVQRYTAVTAACLLIRRAVFEDVGGFDLAYRVAYNDLDLCCRVQARGYVNFWTPYAVLRHYENVSRGDPLESALDIHERDRFRAAWAKGAGVRDPGFNPCLTLGGGMATP